MIDQSHNIEGKVDAMIQSVMNIQTAYAKALLVDEEALIAAQRQGDVLEAHRLLRRGVRDATSGLLLEQFRGARGIEPDPVAAFRAGGYAERLATERGSTPIQSAYERQ